MRRAARGLASLLVILSVLGVADLTFAAPADSDRKGFDLPPRSLAAGDAVGHAIFERDGKRVALSPKAVQERIENRAAPAPGPPAPPLPAWPAKWAGDSDAADASSY